MSRTKLTLVPALALFASALFAQSSQHIQGTVTDSNCGAHHGMKGLTAAQCARACIKSGASYALVSGDKVYMLKGDKAMFDKYAGDAVVIDGETSGNTVTVKTIKPA